MPKVEWICIVPNCKSNSRVPGHFFPKNVTLSHKWKEAIINNIISNVSSEELRKYRVCHLHFLSDDYIYSQNRRRLKHNAVPSVNIYNIETNIAETHDTNITELHSNITEQVEIHEVSDLLNEQYGTSIQTNTKTDNELQSKISSSINEISSSNIECVETNASQTIPNDSINEPINRPSTPKTSRSILAATTRQSQLTPTARKIYKKAVTLAKEKNQMKAQVVRYRQRLKDAKKFADTQFCNKFNTLTPTQRLFFNMQLKNIKYSPKTMILLFGK